MKRLFLSILVCTAAQAQIVSMSIGSPQYTDAGFAADVAGGTFVGLRANHQYGVLVCAAGTPDTVQFDRDGGLYTSCVSATGSPQPLAYPAGTISTCSWASGRASCTTTAPHGMADGALVTIAGTAPSGYSVTGLSVLVTGVSSFSVSLATNPGTYVSGGTATASDGLTITLATTGHTAGAVLTVEADGNASPPTFMAHGLGAVARATQAKLRETVSIMDYGADPTGLTDSSAAIMAAVRAAGVGAPLAVAITGGTASGPCGNYSIAQTVTLVSADAMTFKGAGGCTTFTWTGNSTSPMFLVQGCYRCIIGDFTIYANAAHPLLYGIQMANNGIGIVSTLTRLEHVRINGGSVLTPYLTTGLYLGGSVNGNNDQISVEDVLVQGASHSGYTISTGATQSLDNIFRHCGFQFTTRGVEVLDGSLKWEDGDGGGSTVADFDVPGVTGDIISIDYGRFEGSNMFLTTESGLTAAPMSTYIHHVAYAGNCNGDSDIADLSSGSCITPSGNAIVFNRPGTLTLEDSTIGTNAPYDLTICMTTAYDATIAGPSTFVVSGTRFGSEHFLTAKDVFPCGMPSILQGSYIFNANTFAKHVLGDAARDKFSATNTAVTNAQEQGLTNYHMDSQQVTAVSVPIPAPVFTGTGLLNDMFSGGWTSLTSSPVVAVKISATGTRDAYQWNVNGGAFSAALPILCGGQYQPLAFGLTVAWSACTGHIAGDLWTITPVPAQSAPVIVAGAGDGANGSGSTTGPIQCGFDKSTAYYPCLDGGSPFAGPVLVGLNDPGNKSAWGFAHRVGPTGVPSTPFFISHQDGTALVPRTFASISTSCGTAFAGFEDTITDSPTGVLGSVVAAGGGAYQVKIQCSGVTGHWFVTAAEGAVAAGTVTHTAGPLTLNAILVGNGSADIKIGDLTGDVTTSGSQVTTLAASGVSAATYGDASHSAQITFDAKGRATSATSIAINGGATGTVGITATCSLATTSGTACATAMCTGGGGTISVLTSVSISGCTVSPSSMTFSGGFKQ